MLGVVRELFIHGRNVRRVFGLRHLGLVNPTLKPIPFPRYESSTTESTSDGNGRLVGGGDSISHAEAKKLLKSGDMEALKMKLGLQGKEIIVYSDLLKACQSLGVARSPDEAASFAQELDEAGVVLLLGDKVYLHPDKVVDQVRRSVPLALTAEDDPKREELRKLREEKEKLDELAHKQVRRILWSGLGFAVMQFGIFFHLTFWELSWDVMEPVAFFGTTAEIIVSYSYFLITAKDPTYRDFMDRIFQSRQRKLFKKHNFDIKRFKELQERCKFPHAL